MKLLIRKLEGYTCILYLFLFAAFTIPAKQALAQKESVFFVQLGVFSKKPTNQIEQVKNLGAIYIENTGKNQQRYLLGQFAMRVDAEKTLKDVKAKGFSDAFIVERQIDNVPTIYDNLDLIQGDNGNKGGVQPSRKNDQSKAFLVQVGVFGGKIPMNEILPLVSIGNIYTEKTNTATKVFVGTFASRKAADEPLKVAKASGFKGAFVKEMPISALELLIEQRQGIPQGNTPNLQIAAVSFSNPIEEFSLPYPTDSVEIHGNILPLTQNDFLFHGYIRIKGDMYAQTLLLRSDNSGKNWTEVFKGEYGYDIRYLEFVNEQTAFMMTMGYVEGPGALTLYRTDNKGIAWKEVGNIPKNEHYCYPTYLRMNDVKFGTVVYNCEDETNFLWSTSDGGANWQYKGTMSKSAFKNLPPYQAESANGIYASQDGTKFFKQTDTDNYYIVFQLNTASNAWEEMFRLNRWYKLKEGVAISF